MKAAVKSVLVYASVLLLLLLLVPAGYLAYLYFTYINETLTSGSGYGFMIGQSKREAYEAAEREFRAGRLVGIDTIQDREDEIRSNPWLEGDLSIDQVRGRIDRWDHWSLTLHAPDDRPHLLAVCVFEGNELSGVGQPGKLSSSWRTSEYPALAIRQGQTRAQVADLLKALSSSPGFDSLRVSTGWMARRQPKTLAPSEFELVENEDDWTLLVDHKWSYFNTVRLRFRDGALAEIHRHRQYFELP